MRRRDFIAAFAGAVLVWPIAARAQQSTSPVVALINGGTAVASAPYAAAFRKGLSEMGYDEQKNVTVEYHWLEGQYALLPDLLDNLIRRRVAVIATPGSTPASLAAKAATATIPIVFGVGDDPVALGLIANLAKPSGNVTGINVFAFEVNAKRLSLMHELLPKATRFAVVVNPDKLHPPSPLRARLGKQLTASGWTCFSSKPALPLRSTPPSPLWLANESMLFSSQPTASSPVAEFNLPHWPCATGYPRAFMGARVSKPASS